jgi:hypothetical protein
MMLTELLRRDSTAKGVEKDHLSAINIDDSGITMNIVIRKNTSNQSLVYNAYVNIVADDRTLKINDMDNGILSVLVGKYREYVIEAVKGNGIRNSITEKNINILTYALRDVKKLEDIASFAEDLRKIDTYTIDAFDNNALEGNT